MAGLSLTVRAQEGGETCRSKEEMAEEEEGGVKAEDVTIGESMMPTTMATTEPTTMRTVTSLGTTIESENGIGATSAYVKCDPTQVHQVIHMDHGRA
jgi:hypothetical protein